MSVSTQYFIEKELNQNNNKHNAAIIITFYWTANAHKNS